MKQLFAFSVMLFLVVMLRAQDTINLRSGEIVNGKVVEVGTVEIRYYKSTNPEGPVYVLPKADVSQIIYANGNKDVFTAAAQQQTVIGQQSVPQTVIVEQPVRRRHYCYGGWWYPIVTAHIDLGHHGSYYGGHFGGHHGHH